MDQTLAICAVAAIGAHVVVMFILAGTVRSLANRVLVTRGNDVATLVREERRTLVNSSGDDIPPPLSPDAGQASEKAWSEDFARDFERGGAQSV